LLRCKRAEKVTHGISAHSNPRFLTPAIQKKQLKKSQKFHEAISYIALVGYFLPRKTAEKKVDKHVGRNIFRK
jgi:hypothetical protein